jgi:hypothetical protein
VGKASCFQRSMMRPPPRSERFCAGRCADGSIGRRARSGLARCQATAAERAPEPRGVSRASARSVFPLGVQASSRARPHRVAEQGPGLWPVTQSCRRNPDHRCGEPTQARRSRYQSCSSRARRISRSFLKNTSSFPRLFRGFFALLARNGEQHLALALNALAPFFRRT